MDNFSDERSYGLYLAPPTVALCKILIVKSLEME
jgi:hypothetical protein